MPLSLLSSLSCKEAELDDEEEEEPDVTSVKDVVKLLVLILFIGCIAPVAPESVSDDAEAATLVDESDAVGCEVKSNIRIPDCIGVNEGYMRPTALVDEEVDEAGGGGGTVCTKFSGE